jgi:uncharacterized protein YecT (DUF1311 family)
MKHTLALLALLAAGPAFANSACDHVTNDFDGLYCLNKVYQQADTDLNATYRQLVAKLDAEGRATLRKHQLQWMAERNVSCSMRKDGAFYVDLDCATRVTIERTRFLQDRVRECVSAGCMNSRL